MNDCTVEIDAETGARRRASRCDNCLFGFVAEITREKKRMGRKPKLAEGETPPPPEMITTTVCECHVARPTKFGFPKVRLDDFCSMHVNADTLERTYAGLASAE